jgi:hypothetical protein
VIGEVKRLRPELKSRAYIHWQFLEQADVPVLESRTMNRVANVALQVERARRRRYEDRASVVVTPKYWFRLLAEFENCPRILGVLFMTQNCPALPQPKLPTSPASA